MNEIFVFGSNLAGIHDAGAALWARKYCGAEPGVGIGPTGDAYAIPTKDHNLHTLNLNEISQYVSDFKNYARHHADKQFYVTRIGCGLAGYTNEQIGPMFIGSPPNCILPSWWLIFLDEETRHRVSHHSHR